MICDSCGRSATLITMVLNGKFGKYCNACKSEADRFANGQSAQYYRDRDREDHQRDILQPWVNGKINPEFARQYPDKAKDYFSEEELKEV